MSSKVPSKRGPDHTDCGRVGRLAGVPTLLILCICVMAQWLRWDLGISEVPIPSSSREETRVLDYMDDLNVLCRDKWAVERMLKYTQIYEAVAEAKLSESKGTCMGRLRDLLAPGVSITHERVKILRVEFDPQLKAQGA